MKSAFHLTHRWLTPGIIAAILLTGLVVFTGFLSFLRPVIVFSFFLVCPGISYIQLLDLKKSITEIVLIVALSLGIDLAVSMILLYSGIWSYRTGFLMLSGISLLGSIILWFHEGRGGKE